jgi:hypothetical protein
MFVCCISTGGCHDPSFPVVVEAYHAEMFMSIRMLLAFPKVDSRKGGRFVRKKAAS